MPRQKEQRPTHQPRFSKAVVQFARTYHNWLTDEHTTTKMLEDSITLDEATLMIGRFRDMADLLLAIKHHKQYPQAALVIHRTEGGR